jgi:transcriptional regulator with XRE-family HTH domain
VDVSDTIEARIYNAQRATLLQRRPSTIIDAAESFHSAVPMQFYGGGQTHLIGSHRMVTKLTGATRTVLIVDTDVLLATSAIPTVTVEDFDADSWSRWSKASKEAFQKAAVAAKAPPSAAARLRVERLAALQAALGLSTSDLAQALGLSRPGLYKWLDASSDVKLQGASRERLAAVERIAKQWRERSTAPLSSVSNEPLADGSTVLAMMMADQVDEAAVVGAFDELLAMLAGKPKTRSQKLADAGFRRRPSAKSLPSDE